MNVIKQAVAVDLKQRSVGMDHSEDSFFTTRRNRVIANSDIITAFLLSILAALSITIPFRQLTYFTPQLIAVAIFTDKTNGDPLHLIRRFQHDRQTDRHNG